MRRLGKPRNSFPVLIIFFYVFFCSLLLLSTEAHFVFPVWVLTARSSFQVQATHHLFPTVGKRTELAQGREAGAMRARESIKPHSNCQHQSSSSSSGTASTTSKLLARPDLGKCKSNVHYSRLQPFFFHLAVFRSADPGLTTGGTDQRRAAANGGPRRIPREPEPRWPPVSRQPRLPTSAPTVRSFVETGAF